MFAVLIAVALSAATPTTATASTTPAPLPTTFDDVDYGFAAERDVVVNGLRLRLLEAGPADGPRLLLLHCFGLSSQVWRAVMPALAAAGYRVAAYDAPGHGKSDRATRPLRLDDLGKTAAGVLDVLQWPDAVVVGSSMGGATALTLAITDPTRVSSLVLVDAAGLDLRAWFGPAWQMLDPRHAAFAADWMWGVAFDLAVERHTPLGDRVRAELLSTRHDPEAERAAFAFKTIVDDLLVVDRTPGLGRITARTLVVTGAHDRLVDPDHARRLTDGIQGARLLTYDDLGHLPQLEDPQRLSTDILGFLQSTRR